MAQRSYRNGPDIEFPSFDWGRLRGRLKGWWVALAAALLWLLSGFYLVGPDENGVVRRFGRLARIESPGIHYHLPYPLEVVNTPKVTEAKRLEIGFRTVSPGPPAKYRDVPDESTMLTGDENIVNADMIVQYKIRDPARYLFNVRGQEEAVANAAEAALRQVIAQRVIDEALTVGKAEIQEDAKSLLQSILDEYEAGILVLAVQLQDVHPPQPVVDAFKDVASAKEDKNRLINEAEGYRNSVLPQARGQAEKMLREAEAYKEERVKRAEGDADRFRALLEEYRKAKQVTWDRLYLETMEEVLPRVKKYIMETERGAGVLGLLEFGGASAARAKKKAGP
jgi:membrane protease subunit HflK